MKKQLKTQKGITLVALIITVILLLILAGVAISSIMGNGLLGKAKYTKEKQDEAEELEKTRLSEYESEINRHNNQKQSGNEENESEQTDKQENDSEQSKQNWNEKQKVNTPELLTGMTPIKFTEPTESAEGEIVTTTADDQSWYDYNSKKWANVKTIDGSMWVWIPRFAYKIDKTNQKFDIVFLQGTTDEYQKNGETKKAQRQTKLEQTIDTTADYTVHPAFTNESNIGFANGGWDKELSGIWVAKFEAGYAGGNNSVTPTTDSNVEYSQKNVWVRKGEDGTNEESSQPARNLYGDYGEAKTKIKYPTFQGMTYSMNYINQNDAYNLSRDLTSSQNIYGLESGNADSHLMKNSEWGAVAYLSKSIFGLDTEDININNVSLNNSIRSIYAITGMCSLTTKSTGLASTKDEINNRTIQYAYNWKQLKGTKASTTGNIYGRYDMSGGNYERTAGLVANGNMYLTNHGGSMLNNGAKDSTSTKYVTVYKSNDSGESDINSGSQKNYNANKIYGDGIKETSTSGTGSNSWFKDNSSFPALHGPFIMRGGNLWTGENSGLFNFTRDGGGSSYYGGFRSVLVKE